MGGAAEFGGQDLGRAGGLVRRGRGRALCGPAGECGVRRTALVQVGGAHQQGRLVDGLEQELQVPGVVGGAAPGVVVGGAERFDQPEAEPQRGVGGLGGGVPVGDPAAQFGDVPGRGVDLAGRGGEGVQPAVGGRPAGIGEGRLGQCGAGLGVHQGGQGGVEQRLPGGRAGWPLTEQYGRAARRECGGLVAPGRGGVGPPAGQWTAVGQDEQRQHPAPADRAPGEVVHPGEPAQRGAVDHLDPAGAGQVGVGDGPVRVVDLAEQLGGGSGVEEQRGNPPGGEDGTAARRGDRQVGRGGGQGADGGQQEGGPAFGGLCGEPAEPGPDAAEDGGQAPGRAGEGVGARGGPVGPGFAGSGVGAGVLGPEGQPSVRPPERVQDEHAGPSGGSDCPSQPSRVVRQCPSARAPGRSGGPEERFGRRLQAHG